ncbi:MULTISPECIES: LacI family DNA-binding transcriptional regulator [unclassified Modicisalibacter]|uniref:LacI family DNA-binding transcriptional regulator n=1 Tax=unclassified Modicisalibacter TaxID=2679913 RepID=UPI001CCB2C4D|nr:MULTISPECIES: LacI family DNA-binding transcriptional regulator [unclassified Modicisalibacter]MBZ9559232.1 LacI family DNA-binding transcriptional regulator [Modicisalibacter sp. R2A 31.J]MBZ9576603.1 LacI family DNA-binding transcriptional regulator [Modicisalibacter sp. MOD 31.J]
MPATSRSTILEVARDAGVSKTSVSRYLGGERHRLSATLQRRIAASITRLGYRPNQMARGLKGGRSRLLGMVVADIRNPFTVDVLHGVEQACREQGFSLLVCNTDNDPAQEREHLALLAAYRVEGLVVNAAGRPSAELRTLAGQGTPVVLLDRTLADFEADVVGLDNGRAVDTALDHLLAQGYTRLLYLGEPPEAASSRQRRRERFRQRLAAGGFTGDVIELAMPPQDPSLARALAAWLAEAPDDANALLCANGNVTLAVAHALRELDVTLGEVGLLGIDELDWCALAGPGITTLAQPTEAIGRAAVASLMRRLDADTAATPPRRTDYMGRLIQRGSTQRQGGVLPPNNRHEPTRPDPGDLA